MKFMDCLRIVMSVGILLLAACESTAPLSVGAGAEEIPGRVVRVTSNAEARGWLLTRDGIRLRYHLILPEGDGPFPTIINYEGYAAGSDFSDNGAGTYKEALLERGYALLGVSVRGTGCSEGDFNPFVRNLGEDGYDAIEWTAAQPWSDGRVGMIGASFGGITQELPELRRHLTNCPNLTITITATPLRITRITATPYQLPQFAA